VAGKQAAIAAAENTAALLYDKTLTKQAHLPALTTGMGWDDLVSWGTKVTAFTGGKTAGMADGSGVFQVLEVWLRQRGKEFYKDGKLWVNASDIEGPRVFRTGV
jgi:multiple sugar transport system substrate-binding protein